jgi:hypothetical protein
MAKNDDIKQDKKLIKKAFAMHDKQEHHGKHTNLTKLKSGGIAGVSSESMKAMGRNMARATNQRGR